MILFRLEKYQFRYCEGKTRSNPAPFDLWREVREEVLIFLTKKSVTVQMTDTVRFHF